MAIYFNANYQMKRIIFFLLLFSCIASGAEAQRQVKTFVPDKSVHDFGMIEEKKGKVNCTFQFTNRCAKPVVIIAANAFCGCTSTSFTKGAIAPGKKAQVTVTFDPANRQGDFKKEVNVVLNDGKEFVKVWVKGNVKPYLHPVTEDHPYAFGEGLYMSHAVLSFAGLKQGDCYSFPLHIANDTNKPMTVRFVRHPNNRVLKMPDEITLKPLERRVITVSYKAPKTYTYNRRIRIDVFVNGKKVKPLPVRWYGTGNKNVLHYK